MADIKIFNGAKVVFDPSEPKQGQYGPYQTVKVTHPDFPETEYNGKKYRDMAIHFAPGSTESALRKGMKVNVVVQDGKAKIAGGPELTATPNGTAPKIDAGNPFLPFHPGELDAPGRAHLAELVKSWAGVYVHARASILEKEAATKGGNGTIISEESCHAAAVTILIEAMRLYRVQ